MIGPAGIAKLFSHTDLATGWCMKIPSAMPRLKGYRHPREIIAYAVWAYHRFALSTADVEDLLAERGVFISRETIRLWVNRFGAHFAACIRRDRPRPNDKWHLDSHVGKIRQPQPTGFMALVETVMGRYKGVIRPRLRARSFLAQQTEAAIGVTILKADNPDRSFGWPLPKKSQRLRACKGPVQHGPIMEVFIAATTSGRRHY